MPAVTNIDWEAYMEEVQFFLDGERNYVKMRGDTGPLVYPAGFVYIYSLLSAATGGGRDVVTGAYKLMVQAFGLTSLAGQWIFVIIYLATLLVIGLIYGSFRCARSLWRSGTG